MVTHSRKILTTQSMIPSLDRMHNQPKFMGTVWLIATESLHRTNYFCMWHWMRQNRKTEGKRMLPSDLDQIKARRKSIWCFMRRMWMFYQARVAARKTTGVTLLRRTSHWYWYIEFFPKHPLINVRLRSPQQTHSDHRRNGLTRQGLPFIS